MKHTAIDVYFDQVYGKLYEEIEGGTCVAFDYSCEHGIVKSVFIKRPLQWLVNGAQYFDIVTPYGYGGPLVVEAVDRERLIENYWTAWVDYCGRERIVCEFVRFHPLVNNHIDFGEYYGAEFNRYTLAIDLSDDDYEGNQFTAKCRNMVRKAEKLGVICEIDEEGECIDMFCDLYHKTMQKDNADNYYFFSLEYFKTLREVLEGQLVLINALLNGKTIAASLIMLSKNLMHYHLSATDPDYYGYAANNLILKTAAKYGGEKGLKWFHLGGGLSSSDEDNLFKFKRSFAREDRNLKEFYLGRAVYDNAVYEKLVEARREQDVLDEDSMFFPKYRQK
jgi:hypothetical protein